MDGDSQNWFSVHQTTACIIRWVLCLLTLVTVTADSQYNAAQYIKVLNDHVKLIPSPFFDAHNTQILLLEPS